MNEIVRLQVKVVGQGFSEQLAKVDAYNKLKESYKQNVLVLGMINCVQIEAPTLASQCTTQNYKAEGARKWKTMHEIYAQNPNNPKDWKKAGESDNKTDAVKTAKEMTLKLQSNFRVKLVKILAAPDEHIEASIEPKNAKPGSWEITLDIAVKQEDVNMA